jgi:hypothetical protein
VDGATRNSPGTRGERGRREEKRDVAQEQTGLVEGRTGLIEQKERRTLQWMGREEMGRRAFASE